MSNTIDFVLRQIKTHRVTTYSPIPILKLTQPQSYVPSYQNGIFPHNESPKADDFLKLFLNGLIDIFTVTFKLNNTLCGYERFKKYALNVMMKKYGMDYDTLVKGEGYSESTMDCILSCMYPENIFDFWNFSMVVMLSMISNGVITEKMLHSPNMNGNKSSGTTNIHPLECKSCGLISTDSSANNDHLLFLSIKNPKDRMCTHNRGNVIETNEAEIPTGFAASNILFTSSDTPIYFCLSCFFEMFNKSSLARQKNMKPTKNKDVEGNGREGEGEGKDILDDSPEEISDETMKKEFMSNLDCMTQMISLAKQNNTHSFKLTYTYRVTSKVHSPSRKNSGHADGKKEEIVVAKDIEFSVCPSDLQIYTNSVSAKNEDRYSGFLTDNILTLMKCIGNICRYEEDNDGMNLISDEFCDTVISFVSQNTSKWMDLIRKNNSTDFKSINTDKAEFFSQNNFSYKSVRDMVNISTILFTNSMSSLYSFILFLSLYIRTFSVINV